MPTPIDASKQPNLEPLKSASAAVGSVLRHGGIVVYESTVYPGVTEEICIPALESASGLKWKTDFNVGYSPERINPGDRERRFDNILKIVSADTPETLEIVDAVYRSVVKAGTHRAPSIRVAEFAKVLENTQRDRQHCVDQRGRAHLSTAGRRHSKTSCRRPAPSGTSCHFGRVWSVATASASTHSTSAHKAEAVGYHPEVILPGGE